jgi:hypothetical protein
MILPRTFRNSHETRSTKADPPPPIPIADSRSDRQTKQRQRRRVAKARLEVAKDILAALDRGNDPEKEG